MLHQQWPPGMPRPSHWLDSWWRLLVSPEVSKSLTKVTWFTRGFDLGNHWTFCVICGCSCWTSFANWPGEQKETDELVELAGDEDDEVGAGEEQSENHQLVTDGSLNLLWVPRKPKSKSTATWSYEVYPSFSSCGSCTSWLSEGEVYVVKTFSGLCVTVPEANLQLWSPPPAEEGATFCSLMVRFHPYACEVKNICSLRSWFISLLDL